MTRERKMPDTVKILLATNKEQRKRLQAADALAEAAQGLIDLDKADGLWHIELQLALAAYRAGAADMAEGERRQVETLAGRPVNVKYEAHANLFQISDSRSCTVLTPGNAATLRDELTRLLAVALPVDPAPPPERGRERRESGQCCYRCGGTVHFAWAVPGHPNARFCGAGCHDRYVAERPAAAPSPGPRLKRPCHCGVVEDLGLTRDGHQVGMLVLTNANGEVMHAEEKCAAASSGKREHDWWSAVSHTVRDVRCTRCGQRQDSNPSEACPGGAERAEPERCPCGMCSKCKAGDVDNCILEPRGGKGSAP